MLNYNRDYPSSLLMGRLQGMSISVQFGGSPAEFLCAVGQAAWYPHSHLALKQGDGRIRS